MCEINKDFSLYFTTTDENNDQLVLPYPLLVKNAKLQCCLVECWLDLEWDNVPEGSFKVFNGQQWVEGLSVDPGRYTSIYALMKAVKEAIPGNDRRHFSFQMQQDRGNNLKIVTKQGRGIAFGPCLSKILGREELKTNEGTTHGTIDMYWNQPQVTILAPHLINKSFLNNQFKPVLAMVPPEYAMGSRCFRPAYPIYKDVEGNGLIETLQFALEAPVPIEKKRMTIHLHFHLTDQ